LFEILRIHKKWLVYSPLGLYWLLIFTLTTIPTTHIPDVGIGDKISHFLAYFGLAILVDLTLQFQLRFPKMNSSPHIYTLIFVTVYGLLDELHQLLVPGRMCALDDWIADIIGGIIGILLLVILKRIDLKYFNN
jgi:VanZ family protein